MISDKTICALSTPPGTAGISVIRLSGVDALAIADHLFTGSKKISDAKSHSILIGRLAFGGIDLDEVAVSVFRNPSSYTGEDVVEISCHGNPLIVESILSSLVKCGATPATAGEFTRRAFLNGKLNLTQVEAVADLIHTSSTLGVQTAARQLKGGLTQRIAVLREELIKLCGLLELELDFSQEDLEFVDRTQLLALVDQVIETCQTVRSSLRGSEILRGGYFVGIVGFPNAGKSSLFNAMLGRHRAIVSDVAGTTRDFLEEAIYLRGIRLQLFDTAGIRDTTDAIELEGIVLAESVVSQCNLVLVVNDASEGWKRSDELLKSLLSRFSEVEFIVVHNKIDECTNDTDAMEVEHRISAKTGEGIPQLLASIGERALHSTAGVGDVLLNGRHALLLGEAIASMYSARSALVNGMSNDLIAIDLRSALQSLGEVVGIVYSEEILNAVFASFCIGK